MIHDRRIKLNRDFNFRSNCEQFLRMRNFSNPSIPIIESRSISHDRIVCFLKMIYICIRNYEITRRKNKQVPSLFISRSIKRYRDVTTQEEEGQLKSCSFKMMNGNRRRWSDRASILKPAARKTFQGRFAGLFRRGIWSEVKRASRGRRKRSKGKEDHDSPSFVTNFLAHYKYMEFYFNPIFPLLMRYLFI